MIYSITFELKRDPSTRDRRVNSLIWAKSENEPTIDKVQKLVERLYGEDAVKRTIRITKGGDERDEKQMQKGARIYDLDQE